MLVEHFIWPLRLQTCFCALNEWISVSSSFLWKWNSSGKQISTLTRFKTWARHYITQMYTIFIIMNARANGQKAKRKTKRAQKMMMWQQEKNAFLMELFLFQSFLLFAWFIYSSSVRWCFHTLRLFITVRYKLAGHLNDNAERKKSDTDKKKWNLIFLSRQVDILREIC